MATGIKITIALKLFFVVVFCVFVSVEIDAEQLRVDGTSLQDYIEISYI